tara:strand:- start:13273 stop:13812 length:540 start_codon:yes stop_codon:yes gene_type:complete
MSNLIFFREKQLLTQDELAEKSGVSVRTIQRIEAGANLKGHTLKSIALALEINPDELTNSLQEEEKKINYPLIKFINLSSLLFFIPLANIIAPLLIIHLKKEKNILTKQIVSVQIMWTIASLVLFLITPFIQKWFSLSRQLILVVLMVIILSNIYIIIRNTIEIDKNRKLYIKLKFSFI